MKLSDLFKNAGIGGKDKQQSYSYIGDGNQIVQKSISKSSPAFKATQPSNAPTVPGAAPSDGFKFMTRKPEQVTDFSGYPAAARADLQGVDYFKNLAQNAVKPETQQAAIDWLNRQLGGDEEQVMGDATMQSGDDEIDFSTHTTDVAYGAEQLNQIYGSKTPEELWALRQQLRLNQSEAAQGWEETPNDPNQQVQSSGDIYELLDRQRSDALAGMLPEEGMGYKLPGVTGQHGYTFGDQMAVNKSKADIFGTQISSLDKFMSDQNKAAGSNNQNIDNERALMTSFNSLPVVKEYNAARDAYQMIQSIDSMSKNPSQHQALITKYAKFLDPTSVVRESEFAVTQKYSQSKLKQISKEIEHAMNGTGVLSKDAIEAIQGATKELFNTYDTSYQSIKKQYEGLAERQGLNPQNVVFDYSNGVNDNNQQNSDIQTINGVNYKKRPDGSYEVVAFNQVGSGTNKAPKVVAGYDISSYATDPNHERSVATIYQRTPPFKTAADIDMVIRKVAPKSKITGNMVATAASTYGVDPKMVYAIMLQDSSLGTAGMGARNNNPGNIGQYDNLGRPVAGYQTLQGGVNAVAKWLSRKKVNQVSKNYA